MTYIRKIMKISWAEKKSNREEMAMAGYKRHQKKTTILEAGKANIEWKDVW